MSAGLTPSAANFRAVMRSATASFTASSTARSERLRLQKSTATPLAGSRWITAAMSSGAAASPARTMKGRSLRPASSALDTWPAGEGTMTARGPWRAAPGRADGGAASRRLIPSAKPWPVRSTTAMRGGGALRANSVGPAMPSVSPTGVRHREIQKPAVRT